jgi:hypothetical protein
MQTELKFFKTAELKGKATKPKDIEVPYNKETFKFDQLTELT